MRARGADLVVRALEAEGVRFTFGIPGTHTIELYDALERSGSIRPILVTNEQSAGFMADGVARTSDSIGVLTLVPGAGVTHSLSGVAEAWMDHVPLLVLACGIRTDTARAYQLHAIDQRALLAPVTKAVLVPESPEAIERTVRQAIGLARTGVPGPVAVEIPAQHYFLTFPASSPGTGAGRVGQPQPPAPREEDLVEAATLLGAARAPALYVGNGARAAASGIRALAERLQAPVTTTIQGKGVFPEDHPLWLWPGFGASAPPFVREVMDRCDALLAVGCRFGEVATASYGMAPPANLIHVDIDPGVFHRNYPARLAVAADAHTFVQGLLGRLSARPTDEVLAALIAAGHRALAARWRADTSRRGVTPARLFERLRAAAGPGAIFTTDSGNGTFLAMEHLRIGPAERCIGPVDFSCMGYAVPAAIGAKLANPERSVVAIAGDGALLMTGLELLTAAANGAGVVVLVLRDGELGQIAQFQRRAMGNAPCATLAPYDVAALARAAGAQALALPDDASIDDVLARALSAASHGTPQVVDVAIDYAQPTFFTRGVLATNFGRLPMGDRLRVLARLAGRRLAHAAGQG